MIRFFFLGGGVGLFIYLFYREAVLAFVFDQASNVDPYQDQKGTRWALDTVQKLHPSER